jgi:hypothetical protein
VVQIDIYCTSHSEVYVNNEEKIFIKKFGSLNTLSTKEILEFMRMRLEPRSNDFWKVLNGRNLNPLRVNKLSVKEKKHIRDNLEDILFQLKN